MNFLESRAILKVLHRLILKFKIGFLTVAFFIISSSLLAHDANYSFFNIETKHGYWLVTASLPWTIREVLLNNFPQLESANEGDYENSLKQYWKSNFKLQGLSDYELELKDFFIKKGESHHVDIVAYYEFEDVTCIENSLMLSRSKKQINEHQFKTANEKFQFITSSENNRWCLSQSPSNPIAFVISGITGILALIGLIRIAN